MTKDTTVMLKGYSMNLKMRLSEVYYLPLIKFLTPLCVAYEFNRKQKNLN